MPDWCIPECVVFGYYRMGIYAGITVQPFCLHLKRVNAIVNDKQYEVSWHVVNQAVNSQGWAYQTEGEGSQAETLPLGQVENAEVRNTKYGNRSTEVRRKTACGCLVAYWPRMCVLRPCSQRVTLPCDVRAGSWFLESQGASLSI